MAVADVGRTLALMAPRPPRNHHLLAKLYQRGFANDAGQAGLLVRETGEWDAPRNIATLFREPHFYAFVDDDGVRRQDFEELLAHEVESPAGEGFKDLRAGTFPLRAERREHVGRFIAAQVTRGRHVRGATTEFTGGVDRAVLRLMLAHGTRAHWERWLGRVPTEEERNAWAQGAPTPFDTKQQDVLVAQLGSIDVVTELLLERIWTLVSFERPCLFTSDEPVTMVSGKRMAAVGTADDIALPVSTGSRRHASCSSWRRLDGRTERRTPRHCRPAPIAARCLACRALKSASASALAAPGRAATHLPRRPRRSPPKPS